MGISGIKTLLQEPERDHRPGEKATETRTSWGCVNSWCVSYLILIPPVQSSQYLFYTCLSKCIDLSFSFYCSIPIVYCSSTDLISCSSSVSQSVSQAAGQDIRYCTLQYSERPVRSGLSPFNCLVSCVNSIPPAHTQSEER